MNTHQTKKNVICHQYSQKCIRYSRRPTVLGMIPIKGSCSSLLVATAAMSCVGGWGRRPFSFPCVFKAKAPYNYLTVSVAD